MTLPQIISIIGTIPLFSMRTFLPAFLVALFFTYPNLFPGVNDATSINDGASFFAKNWLLIVLGLLTSLEFIGDKNTEVRSLLTEAEPYMKPVIYLLVQFFVVNDSSAEVLNHINWAGFSPLIIIAVIGSGAVFALARLRKKFLDFLYDLDEDDNLFIGRIISWIEDSLVLFGFVLLIWTGITMVIIYALIIGAFMLLRWIYLKQAEKNKKECPNCKTKIFPHAINCFHCGTEQQKIFDVGVFGQAKSILTHDLIKHKYKLTTQRLCTVCAAKLDKRNVYQKCSQCGTNSFSNPDTKAFIKYIDKKFYLILSISFLVGFVPVLGFVVSALLTSILLMAPYRRYISKQGSFLSKLLIKILTLVFFIFGIGFGFIAAPIYCAIRYYIVRSQFKIGVAVASRQFCP